jgi:modification methylase
MCKKKASTITMIHGDCMDYLEGLEDDVFDITVTSPPYNLGHNKRNDGNHPKASRIKYDVYGDDMDAGEYMDWQVAILNKIHSKTKNDGVIYYNHKQRLRNGMYFHPILLCDKTKWKIIQNIIWRRSGGTNFNIGRFVNCHEDIIAMGKDCPMKINAQAEKMFDVWDIPQEKSNHPAAFPEALSDRILSGYSHVERELVVFDPFMGSGTTAVSALKAGFSYIGCEISTTYFNQAVERVEEHNAQLNLFREQAIINKKNL